VLKRTGRNEVLFTIDFEKAYDKVRWSFVQEFMEGKWFPSRWIQQTMCTIQGGRVCFNINGERTQFFRTFQGLRQGDPLSPLLFNLVADTLAKLMSRAAAQGKVKGVLTHLLHEGVTHIQYADDTILMVEGDDKSILNMKFILYCFELLSGLKINYHKSEAFIFGYDEREKIEIANKLNCKLGVLPMKYLAIKISNSKLGKVAFAELHEKIEKRIPPWKEKNSSSRGRLILTNSCMSTLPIYTMGFYLLPLGTHSKMDSVRAIFFWRWAGEEFRYHMVKWPAVCRPKDLGGLGIINTQVLNECLMTKWIWKLYHRKESLWARILTAKYMRNGIDFLRSCASNGSQFWKSLHKIKHLFK
jgi:hypothetical protein